MASKTIVLWPFSIPSILSIQKKERCTRVYVRAPAYVRVRTRRHGAGVEGMEGMENPCSTRLGSLHTSSEGMEQVWKLEVRNRHG